MTLKIVGKWPGLALWPTARMRRGYNSHSVCVCYRATKIPKTTLSLPNMYFYSQYKPSTQLFSTYIVDLKLKQLV